MKHNVNIEMELTLDCKIILELQLEKLNFFQSEIIENFMWKDVDSGTKINGTWSILQHHVFL